MAVVFPWRGGQEADQHGSERLGAHVKGVPVDGIIAVGQAVVADGFLAMLRYLAQALDISPQKLLRGCVLPAVEVKAKEVFEERRLK